MGVQRVSSKGIKKISKRETFSKSHEKAKSRKAEEAIHPFVIVNSGPSSKKSATQDKKRPPKLTEKAKSNVGQSGKEKNNHQNEEKALAKSKAISPSVGAGKKAGSSVLSRSALDQSVETVCREVACEGLATSGGYCRLHYIKNWKKIKRKEVILREKKLNQYIEELIAKYPDKYIEAIRQDLASDKDFAKVIYDLDLDEGVDDFDVEGGEPVDSLIDSIKRDFDDEGDAF